MGKYESPKYQVLTKDGSYEVREYSDFYIVEYDNDYDPEINQEFGTLFTYISNDKEAKMKSDLQEWLESKGHRSQSNYMLAFYNAPFVPPMFRRNEIIVRIL